MQIREFLLERYYAQYEFTTPLQLSASDCEALTVEEVLEAAGAKPDLLMKLPLGYTETQGSPALREAIASFYPDRGPEHVLVFNAPQEAIFLAMHALLKPGDRAIVMSPCYQSLKEVARSLGAEVVEWSLVEGERGWRMDLERLEELLAGGPRLLVTNAPHNPTGLHPTHESWRRIQELVTKSGVRWFSDEMYRGLEPEPSLALSPAACTSPGALSLWGMSKSFGLPGLRIGWLVSSDVELLAKIEKWKDYTSICSNALGEILARLALEVAEPIMAANRERITAHADLVEAFVARYPEDLAWNRPLAGPVALARLLRESASEHAERVRRDGGALLVPGAMFDLGDEHVRVGLGRANFPEALERWETALVES